MSLNPIVPMEPTMSTEIPDDDRWIAQIKWDGVRVLTYFDGGHLQLFNRHLRERTNHYPELSRPAEYCRADSFVLDGEVIALGEDGKPDFHEVMRRDGIRRMDRVQRVRNAVPVTYMVFDLLYLNGEWIHKLPLEDRIHRLEHVLLPGQHVQLVTSHEHGGVLFDVIKQHALEGIVVKQLDSPYLIGEKRDVWKKIKNYGDVVAVIGGYTLNDAGVVNALLLGLYVDGLLTYIGHSGTGKLSRQDWRAITDVLKPLTIPDKPFANLPQRHKDAYWVKPMRTVRIQYAEWMQGRLLRQPSIQALVDVQPNMCVFTPDLIR